MAGKKVVVKDTKCLYYGREATVESTHHNGTICIVHVPGYTEGAFISFAVRTNLLELV